MEKWLECSITPGQFTGEFAVQGKLFDNSGFSLFALKENLRFTGEPTSKKPIKGGLRVVPLEQKDDLMLVALPQPTLENGRTITVKATDILESSE